MKTCPRCGLSVDDHAAFCPRCQQPLGAAPERNAPPRNQGDPRMQQPPQPFNPDPSDHTTEFSPTDISNNKVFALGTYLFGFLGIIVAMLVVKESPYLQFHVRQSMKLSVTSALLGLAAGVLAFTVLVPFAACICYAILGIVKIICILRTIGGKSKEVPILKNFDFLK